MMFLGMLASVAPTGSGPDQATLIGLWVIGATSLASLASNVLNIWRTSTNKPQKREVSFAENYVSKDAWIERIDELNRRLNGHDTDISNLWNTLRSENESIRRELRKGFQDIERALGRIEGKINREV